MSPIERAGPDTAGPWWKWRDETAHARRWPGDETKSVGEAFAEEKPRPLPLPNRSFETYLVLTVCSKKSIHVRFDKNDYSIPPTAVGKPLSLLASDNSVRIFDGTTLPSLTAAPTTKQTKWTSRPTMEALLKLKRKA